MRKSPTTLLSRGEERIGKNELLTGHVEEDGYVAPKRVEEKEEGVKGKVLEVHAQ